MALVSCSLAYLYQIMVVNDREEIGVGWGGERKGTRRVSVPRSGSSMTKWHVGFDDDDGWIRSRMIWVNVCMRLVSEVSLVKVWSMRQKRDDWQWFYVFILKCEKIGEEQRTEDRKREVSRYKMVFLKWVIVFPLHQSLSNMIGVFVYFSFFGFFGGCRSFSKPNPKPCTAIDSKSKNCIAQTLGRRCFPGTISTSL